MSNFKTKNNYFFYNAVKKKEIFCSMCAHRTHDTEIGNINYEINQSKMYDVLWNVTECKRKEMNN